MASSQVQQKSICDQNKNPALNDPLPKCRCSLIGKVVWLIWVKSGQCMGLFVVFRKLGPCCLHWVFLSWLKCYLNTPGFKIPPQILLISKEDMCRISHNFLLCHVANKNVDIYHMYNNILHHPGRIMVWFVIGLCQTRSPPYYISYRF